MKNDPNPSILVLSPSTFNFVTGTGVTFSNLFHGWSKDSIASMHSGMEPEEYSGPCNHFYNARDELRGSRPLLESSTNLNFPQKIKQSLNRWLAGNSGRPKHFSPTEKLEKWLDIRKPKILYTTLGNIPVLEAILWIQKRYDCKLVIHHMDDWYQDAYTTGLFRYQRKHMLRLFHEVVEKAVLRLTICEKMADEYEKRFGVSFEPFQNTVDVLEFQSGLRLKAPATNDRVTLLYFGSIYPYAQKDSLIDIGEVAKKQNEFIFRIVAPAPQLQEFKSALNPNAQIELIPMQNDPLQFQNEISKANGLVLPANFDEATVRFLWLSMPTKIPGYLASGVPILAYGSPQLAQSHYLKKYEVAVMVEERDELKLKAGIQKVLFDLKTRSSISEAAQNLALSKHDRNHVSKIFQTKLSGLMKGQQQKCAD